MKITLPLSGFQDFSIIQDATSHYHKNLKELVEFQNRSQHHIHLSILVQLRWDLAKKLMSQSPSQKPKYKMDIHTAFVLFDALQNYGSVCIVQPDKTILSRLIMELLSHLPRTEDTTDLSVMSNF